MKKPHRKETVCPHCGEYIGVYRWLKSITKIGKTSDKLGFLPVYSQCPSCNEISWSHYSIDLIETSQKLPYIIDSMIEKMDCGSNSLVRLAIINHKYED